MKKILLVALRDFIATVSTRGFIIAMLIAPVFLVAVGLLFPRLINNRAPAVQGEVAIVDPSGQVGGGLRAYLSERTGGEEAQIAVVAISPDERLGLEKQKMTQTDGAENRLALVVVHPDAVVLAGGKTAFGTYDLFVRANLDDRVQNEIRNGLREAIVDARARAAGLERGHLEALTSVARVRSVTVTAHSERETVVAYTRLLPMAFMLLLFMSVLTAGQALLTTTIEEKSSRVMEVILSAVSPMQLMAGKILGQMGVGLVVLVVYSAIGIVGLVSVALLGLLDLSLLAYLLIFFIITYLLMASLWAAVGSAVTDLREAQALMMPMTLLMSLPWMLWLPITRDPNSMFSTALSFLPPVNGFAMLLRLTSATPPPTWQVWLSILVGIGAAAISVWVAAKVFRVGLLMYGKPPNFATLLRWARQG